MSRFTAPVSFALICSAAAMGGDEGVLLKASDANCTRGQTAEVQVRATTIGLVGGLGFNADPVGYVVDLV